MFGLATLAGGSENGTGPGYESTILESVNAIGNADIRGSLSGIENLLDHYPNSKLGYLMMGDLFAARAGRPGLIEHYSRDRLQLEGLRDELGYRWQSGIGGTPAAEGKLPLNLVLSAPMNRHVLVADASVARLYVYENTGAGYRLVDDFFMTIGRKGMVKHVEGDLKTPEGVYFVTSYLPGEGLPARYGPGAFPIDYPNRYDRKLGRTGYGIWIHGTEPENHNRVPLASDGCLSLSNDDFERIRPYISTDGHTPVIIGRSFEWVDPGTLGAANAFAPALVRQWEQDWESLDTDRYLSHYSPAEFEGFESFAANKRAYNRRKTHIDIEIDNLSIYGYPGDQEMLVVTFDMTYHSDDHDSVTRKQQYWKRQDGRWRIVLET